MDANLEAQYQAKHDRYYSTLDDQKKELAMIRGKGKDIVERSDIVQKLSRGRVEVESRQSEFDLVGDAMSIAPEKLQRNNDPGSVDPFSRVAEAIQRQEANEMEIQRLKKMYKQMQQMMLISMFQQEI